MKNEAQGGRPKETPNTLLARELSATIKTLGRVRTIIEKQIEIVETALIYNEDLPINQRLECITQMNVIASGLASNADKLAKFLMDKRVRSNDDDNTQTVSTKNAKDFLKDIVGN